MKADLSAVPAAIRKALKDAPSYPFSHVNAKIKLDQNESPIDFPAHLKNLALEKMQLRAWNRYPDIHAERIAGLIAEYEAWPNEGIVVTPGSNVLLQHLAEAAGIGASVLSVTPGFAIYKQVGKFIAGELVEIPLKENFELPVQEICQAMQGRSGVLYLAAPHAPTGTMPEAKQLQTIIAASQNFIVLLDEAYIDFASHNHKEFLQFQHVGILRTFSKAWGLAGVRAGYMLAQPELASQIQKMALPFNLNVLTECALEVALLHPEYRDAQIQKTILERQRMFAALKAHNTWQVYPSEANFLLFRTFDAAKTYNDLLGMGILLRRQDALPGLQGCLRVSVGTPEENEAFLVAASQLT